MPRILVTIPGKKPQPYRLPLDREVTSLGRAAECDVVIDDPSVSSHHCDMLRVSGGLILQDQESTNGMKLDGEWMTTIDLVSGISVKLGEVNFEIEISQEEKEILSKEDHSPQQCALSPNQEGDGDSLAEALVEDEIEFAKKEFSGAEEEVYERPHGSEPSVIRDRGVGPIGLLLLLLLAVLAFVLGLSIRHFLETGNLLPSQIFGG